MAWNFSAGTKCVPCTGVVKTTAAASSNYGTRLDMQNYDGVHFEAVFSCSAASTGTATFSIVGSDSTGTADASLTAVSTTYAQIAVVSSTDKSSAAAAARHATIDLYRPRYRYLKSKVVRTAKVGIGAVVAHQYGARVEPVLNTTTAASLATTAYATSHLFYVKQTT